MTTSDFEVLEVDRSRGSRRPELWYVRVDTLLNLAAGDSAWAGNWGAVWSNSAPRIIELDPDIEVGCMGAPGSESVSGGLRGCRGRGNLKGGGLWKGEAVSRDMTNGYNR
jgi:hypothetical protein